MKTCHICNNRLVLGATIYCDDRCKKIGLNAKARAERQHEIYTLIFNPLKCKRCAEPVGGKAKYCTKCEDTMSKIPTKRDCKQCGKSFKPKNFTQVYCDGKCRTEKYKFDADIRTCKCCGESFETRDDKKMHCSKACVENKPKRRGKAKDAKPINPMFLVRGPISDMTRGYALDCV